MKNVVSWFLQVVAKTVHPSISDDNILKYSAQSFHVCTVMLLDDIGQNIHYIKKWLIILLHSYQICLQNAKLFAILHNTAMCVNSSAISTLYYIQTLSHLMLRTLLANMAIWENILIPSLIQVVNLLHPQLNFAILPDLPASCWRFCPLFLMLCCLVSVWFNELHMCSPIFVHSCGHYNI